MIGSFWNLCRACPSMPVDKLHSEYRSTYRWHEYTGGPEVVRRPPVPTQFGSSIEPPLPRRKKCPELAYRTHEFISCDEPDSKLPVDNNRARSEERGGTPSRRSKSEGPPQGNGRPNGPIPNGVVINKEEPMKKSSGQAGESSGLFKKTISKLSTEYRLQFVWPHTRKAIKPGATNEVIELPRKSISMGAIKSTQPNLNLPMVHKKRTAKEKEVAVHELEPLFKEPDDVKHEKKHYEKHVSDTERYGFNPGKTGNIDNKNIPNGHIPNMGNESWYKEVIELRKKADEYKCRGWGTEIDPDLYKKQKELWDQVSRRSSLSALSLASVVRPITKEEKEKENNKKSSPTKSVSRFPGHALPIGADNKRRNIARHHLERTTGPDAEEGAILPSPTREKLMPTIPKSRDDESYNSQRSSPKKAANSRHSSPQKGESPKKSCSPKKSAKGRSQSIGPGVVQNESSPKRQIRSASSNPNATSTPASSIKTHKKTPVSTPTGERRPRPTTLSTTARTRQKSSSLPPHARAHSAPNQNLENNHKSSPSSLTVPNLRKTKNSSKQQPRPKSTVYTGPYGTIITDVQPHNIVGLDNKITENDEVVMDVEDEYSISSASPLPPPQEITEHIVKSPPEPTRVRSPEQILMRSPDPVNWTVPLDTGKTFTVTQNVRNGDILNRPQSEFKASTPIDKPPPAPLSAPPELAEQSKMEAWAASSEQNPQQKDKNEIVQPPIVINNQPDVRFDKPVPGSTLRCLDDPMFDTEINVPPASRNTASDVLEKARNRFDRFWAGTNNETPEENV